jgi:anti-sigma factor RsiW
MNCQQTRRWISPYLDSELEATKTFEVSEHLDGCPACRRRFEQERRVDQWLARRLREAPALDWERIERRALNPHRWRITMGAPALLLWHSGAIPGWGRADWIVRQYAQAAPDDAAFDKPTDEAFQLAAVARQALGLDVEVAFAEGVTKYHSIDLISALQRRTSDGTPYVEVRLNCCGMPVVMVLARQADASHFGRVAAEARPGGEPALHAKGWMRWAARTDGTLLTMAASLHGVGHLVTGFHVTG